MPIVMHRLARAAITVAALIAGAATVPRIAVGRAGGGAVLAGAGVVSSGGVGVMAKRLVRG